jgi:hypothetical protein
MDLVLAGQCQEQQNMGGRGRNAAGFFLLSFLVGDGERSVGRWFIVMWDYVCLGMYLSLLWWPQFIPREIPD